MQGYALLQRKVILGSARARIGSKVTDVVCIEIHV